jgi:hypothetical protein
MQSINALSLTSDVNAWLANSRHPRILHVFDHACNLINERREVLSIVTQQIGNGPFNIVVENDICFAEHLSLESLVSVFPTQLNLGDLTIHTEYAKLWSPRPDWEILHARRDDISKSLLIHYQNLGIDTDFGKNAQPYLNTISTPQFPIPNSLPSALAKADLPASINATQKLAGLGVGLTPSGDDFIMGAIYATWIIHPPEIASVLAEKIANIAAPMTTSLSAAWLRSARKGKAGILWHEFFDALLSSEQAAIQESMDRILSIGETSGADALFGFLSLLAAWSVEART